MDVVSRFGLTPVYEIRLGCVLRLPRCTTFRKGMLCYTHRLFRNLPPEKPAREATAVTDLNEVGRQRSGNQAWRKHGADKPD